MKKIILTFDYELFFGEQSGSAEACIINPTQRICKILAAHNVPAVFFVDAGYLVQLARLSSRDLRVARERELVETQLRELIAAGHDVQLHIHPHWEDTSYQDGKWVMNTRRYRLADFSSSEIHKIVSSYKMGLEAVIGNPVFAYRAGGWCIQPFSATGPALKAADIDVDSTVFRGGRNLSSVGCFDFREAPKEAFWRFSHDPLKPDIGGHFIEIPISSVMVSPLFYWRVLAMRLAKTKKHTQFGDGNSVGRDKTDLLRQLIFASWQAVSSDGLKAALLERAFSSFERHSNTDCYFVTIGHPKVTTSYSLEKFSRFITMAKRRGIFTTFMRERERGFF